MTAQWKEQGSVHAALGNPDMAREQRGLLDLIDKLQFAQLDNVKLPQIIAVGDQSSGKSSVLEAITGTPFPRDSDACTRFPTEIRLRRAKEESCTIFIIPDKKNRTYQEQERLLQFRASLDDNNSFADLMRRAMEEIAPKNVPGRFAAGDVLVVEKRGPELPLLTVVDLPGLVRIPNRDQSAEDLKAIEDITDKYMKSSRAIILAVVGGNQDYTQAAVLQKARHFDPRGERTIGVLTKPDLTPTIGLEDKFLALVNNQEKYYHFDLGWYVLLNPAPRKRGEEWPNAEERGAAEDAFFTVGKWRGLPRDQCGANALKQKLSTQLQKHIGRHLRTLQKEITQAHDACIAELKSMGNGKDTVEEMREELVELCSTSKELVTPAVQGTYTNPLGISFFPKNIDKVGTPPQKLRARAVAENEEFAERVRVHGRKYCFASEDDPSPAGNLWFTTKQDFARDEVQPLLEQNRGTEFPMKHNPRLAYMLFQGYAANWLELAQKHKDTMGVMCNQFLSEVIDYAWPHRMQEPLRRELLDPQMKDLLEGAQKEVERLGQDLQFEVQPYGTEYAERLRKWRAEPLPLGRPHTEAEELLEEMLIYYDIMVKIFIQNVITQVVERHLLQGLQRIFNWLHVHRMRDETVLSIAAENKETRDARLALKAKLLAIEESRDIINGLALRKDLRSFADDLPESEDSDDEGTKTWHGSRHQPDNSLQRKRISRVETPQRSSRLSSDDQRSAAAAMYTPTSSSSGSVQDARQYVNAPSSNAPNRPMKVQMSSSAMPGQYDYSSFTGADSSYPAPTPPPQPSEKEQLSALQRPSTPPGSAGRQSYSSYPTLNSDSARMALNNGTSGVSSDGKKKKLWPYRN